MPRQAMLGALMVGASCVLSQVEAAESVVWHDPNERAFSLLVPKRWTVKGGIFRPGTLVCTGYVEMTSPDGEIYTWIGDHFPAFVEPNHLHAFSGQKPGDRFTDAFGHTWTIHSYTPGQKFLTRFVLPPRGEVRFISERKITSRRQRHFPDIIEVQDIGEVEYRVRRAGEKKERRGGALAVTRQMGNDQARCWFVNQVILYEAPEDRVEEAKRAVLRGILTFRLRPEWLHEQMKGQADRMKIITKTTGEISDILSQSYWSRQEAQARIFKKGSDVRRGVLDVFDPVTGEVRYGVDNKSNYYWINPKGQVVGTDIDDPPGLQFRKLIILP